MQSLDQQEIQQLLADINFNGGEELDTPRRVSVIKVEKTEVPNSGGYWLNNNGLTSTITSYAYSLIQFPVYAVSSLVVIPLANISSKLVGEHTMQSAISILQRLSFVESKEPELEGCAHLLRDLILSQEKTMFYTMTMSTTSTTNTNQNITKTLPNLKWKCALSLSRSQTVIHRANTNSSSYYTFTYLGDFDIDNQRDQNHPLTNKSMKAITNKNKGTTSRNTSAEQSPIQIYINS